MTEKEEIQMFKYQEAKHEEQMYSDLEYAIEYLTIDDELTVKELKEAVKKLENYGHTIEVCDLVREML